MTPLPHTHSCFVCGESNAVGMRLRFHYDGRVVRTEFNPRPEQCGFKGVVHGGITATLLDEMMAWACAVQGGQFGYCAELNVRYQRSLQPDVPVTATAELVANRRNRFFEIKSEIRDASGSLLASATGKYIPIKPADAEQFVGDLIGDLSLLRPPSTPGVG